MTTTTPSNFGAVLKTLRLAAGLTQEALAAKARMSKRGLQDLERGVSQTPRRDTVALLAAALGLSAAERAALAIAARPQPRGTGRPDPATSFATDFLVPLVGRERELALLDRFLASERAPREAAPMLLLAGDPGIGKTRLWQVAASEGMARGWRVLVGGCQRCGGQEPYAPLLGALAQHLQAARPAQVRAALAQLEQSSIAAPPAALYATLGQLAIAAGQYALSEEANHRAVALARASGDQRSLVRAEYNRLCICQLMGRLRAALALGETVVPLAEAVGHLNTLLAVLRDLAYIHALRGDLGPSRGYMERAIWIAGQLQDPGPVAYTRAQRGWILFLCGEWQEARAEIDAAVALSRDAQSSWYSPYPLIFRARVRITEGDRAGATEAGNEALAMVAQSGDLQALRWASGVIAVLEVAEGRPESALAPLLPLLDRPGLQECDVTLLLPVLAEALLELGRLDLAADAVERALARARPEKIRLVLVEALRVKALIALRREQRDEAARDLEEGRALG